MSSYSYSIQTAILLFPIVALVFTLPYLFYQYHRYGSVNSYRTVIIYSFLLYLMVTYFLVILPLPSVSFVAKMTTPNYNLLPFHFIAEILEKTSFHVSDFATYFPTLKNPVVYEALFNILLVVPFGIYLHYYFKKDFKQTLFLSFSLSLFFELTQLTGLYFIYPRSYRVFDVDDLILNTLGGVLGYVLSFVLLKFLPHREDIDRISLENGKKVSAVKRYLCIFADLFVVFVFLFSLFVLLNNFINLSYTFVVILLLIVLFLYYVVLTSILNGKTLVMSYFHLRFVSSKKLKWYHFLVYYFLICFEFIVVPFIVIFVGFIMYTRGVWIETMWQYYIIVVMALYFMLMIITFLKYVLGMSTVVEQVTKIKIQSTIF